MKEKTKLPFLPEGKEILYVGSDNEFMIQAKNACQESGCVKQPTGAVIVKNGKIISTGANAGKVVKECPRWGSPTGENYSPCKDICQQTGHAEANAIKEMMENYSESEYENADLYLYGHWWCCEKCWKEMEKGKIKNVYLLENSENLFNPEKNPEMKKLGKPKKIAIKLKPKRLFFK